MTRTFMFEEKGFQETAADIGRSREFFSERNCGC